MSDMKCYFIKANDEGKVATINGIFHPSQLFSMLGFWGFKQKMQNPPPHNRSMEFRSSMNFNRKSLSEMGYKSYDGLTDKLLKEQIELGQEKAEKGEPFKIDMEWQMEISPYLGPENQVG